MVGLQEVANKFEDLQRIPGVVPAEIMLGAVVVAGCTGAAGAEGMVVKTDSQTAGRAALLGGCAITGRDQGGNPIWSYKPEDWIKRGPTGVEKDGREAWSATSCNKILKASSDPCTGPSTTFLASLQKGQIVWRTEELKDTDGDGASDDRVCRWLITTGAEPPKLN